MGRNYRDGHPRGWGPLSPGGGWGQGMGNWEVTAGDCADRAGGLKAGHACSRTCGQAGLLLDPPRHCLAGLAQRYWAVRTTPVVQKEEEVRAPTKGLAACGLRGHPRMNTEEKYLAEDVGFGARGRASEGG